MDYELAKKLKDMGFPKIRFTTFTATGSDEVILLEGPTLSELIEACVTNKEERCFYRLFYDWFEKQWEAEAYGWKIKGSEEDTTIIVGGQRYKLIEE